MLVSWFGPRGFSLLNGLYWKLDLLITHDVD
jgi:hypothetical protein